AASSEERGGGQDRSEQPRHVPSAFPRPRYQDLLMMPHATRAPELPVGCVLKSSASLWTITDLPTMSVAPLPTVITPSSVERVALPLASACSIGIPPACRSAAVGAPSGVPVG